MVIVHVLAATVALLSGVLALRHPNGTLRHRQAGRAYLLGWVLFAGTGFWLGSARAGVSPFEVLTVLGALCVLVAMHALRYRRTIGPSWRHRHLRWMIISLSFVVVATVNQVLLQTGVPTPRWLFWTLVALPFVVLPRYVRQWRARYPLPSSS